jgi:uncharacterized membrane protein
MKFQLFELKTRTIVEIGIFSALYAALVLFLAPISFWVFQFRIADTLLSLVVRRKHLIFAFTIGTALGNIVSPFGILEITWMPFINILGALSAYYIGKIIKNDFMAFAAGGVVYSLWISFGVATMLNFLLGIPFPPLFVYILIPSLILIVGASPVMKKVNDIMGKEQ